MTIKNGDLPAMPSAIDAITLHDLSVEGFQDLAKCRIGMTKREEIAKCVMIQALREPVGKILMNIPEDEVRQVGRFISKFSVMMADELLNELGRTK